MGLVCSPRYAQTEICVRYITQLLDKCGLKYTFNQRPRFATSELPSHTNILSCLINGKLKQIKVGSADTPDSLRSGNYSWLLIDEVCYVDKNVYNILSPCLRGAGTNFVYQTLMISSPAGRDWVYNDMIAPDSRHVEVIRAPSWENIYEVNQEKLDFWKETMSAKYYLQEVCGEITDTNVGAVYEAFNKECIQPQIVEGNKFLVSLDQNTAPGAGIIAQKRGDNFHILDEIYIDDGANYHSYCREIIKKLPANASVDLFGDRSGNNASVTSIESFYKLLMDELKEKGISVYDKTNICNPYIQQSVQEVNRRFERKQLFIDPKCKHVIKDFEMATWLPGATFKIDKKAYDPHNVDAVRYLIYSFRPGSNIGYIKASKY
jgi:hypothetical protein